MILRIFSTLALLVMAAAMPYWFTLAAMLCLIFYFDRYVEAIAVALLLDFAYSRPIFHVTFLVTLFVLTLFFTAEYCKRQLFI